MRIAVTGASGLVGRFLVRGLSAAGHQVKTLPGWRLGQPAPLEGCAALVHAAFAHVPGKYRGGEGDDPEGFVALNRDASLRLFQQAKAAGVSIQISSPVRTRSGTGWPTRSRCSARPAR